MGCMEGQEIQFLVVLERNVGIYEEINNDDSAKNLIPSVLSLNNSQCRNVQTPEPVISVKI
jgi:hypothetical protein